MGLRSLLHRDVGEYGFSVFSSTVVDTVTTKCSIRSEQMPLDYDRNLVFIHIPRTGGTSIESVFDLMHRDKFFGFPPPVKMQVDKSPQHLTWLELKPLLRSGFSEQAFKISFVRNPWDRFLSVYLYKRRKYLQSLRHWSKQQLGALFHERNYYNESHLWSFDAFVKTLEFSECRRVSIKGGLDGHLETQWSYLSNESGSVAMDFVGRFETFERDIKAVSKRMGLSIHYVPHVNTTAHLRDYRLYYSSYARAAVYNFYLKDIVGFDYTF